MYSSNELKRGSRVCKMVHYLALFLPTIMCMAYVASATHRYTITSEKITTADNRTRGIRDRMNKDFVLGGLMPVHARKTQILPEVGAKIFDAICRSKQCCLR